MTQTSIYGSYAQGFVFADYLQVTKVAMLLPPNENW